MSKLAHPNRPHNVPKYPGPPPRKPPEPPKFLLTEGTEGGGGQQLVKVRGAPTRPKGVSEQPVLSKLSTTTTSRDFDSPAHHYPKRVPYQIPSDMKKPPPRGKGKDSSRDVKQVHRSSIVVEETRPSYGTPLPPTTGVPKLPAIPAPFVPRARAEYAHLPQMHQRTAEGKIFGGATRRYVPAEYVPYQYQDPAAGTQDSAGGEYEYDQAAEYTEGEYDQYQVAEDVPVGPENPMKQLSATWSACWDDEAGAVYYYNQSTGEATWVMPDDLG